MLLRLFDGSLIHCTSLGTAYATRSLQQYFHTSLSLISPQLHVEFFIPHFLYAYHQLDIWPSDAEEKSFCTAAEALGFIARTALHCIEILRLISPHHRVELFIPHFLYAFRQLDIWPTGTKEKSLSRWTTYLHNQYHIN